MIRRLILAIMYMTNSLSKIQKFWMLSNQLMSELRNNKMTLTKNLWIDNLIRVKL